MPNLDRPLMIGFAIGTVIASLLPPVHTGWRLVHDLGVSMMLLGVIGVALHLLIAVTPQSRPRK